ncbi:PKD domain-containing protein [Methanosarcina barkeri]|uniref:PKD domain-containing protein n=1 Tax=Methanosarcina barkeri TaxID=2208 RepID=UPI0006D052B9|nr:PKD domain-containing protein [Methanosarcina barkeri]
MFHLLSSFFDFSENADSLSWSFGDGKRSCCPEPKHTFCCPGNYTISLTAKNDNGSSSTCVVIHVLNSTSQPSAENTISPEDTTYIVNPKNTEDSGSSLRNKNNDTSGILNWKSLESIENFALSFTRTRRLAEVEPSIEHEILRFADTIKNLTENSVSRSEVINISTRAMFFGFLGIALGLSAFRRGRK